METISLGVVYVSAVKLRHDDVHVRGVTGTHKVMSWRCDVDMDQYQWTSL